MSNGWLKLSAFALVGLIVSFLILGFTSTINPYNMNTQNGMNMQGTMNAQNGMNMQGTTNAQNGMNMQGTMNNQSGMSMQDPMSGSTMNGQSMNSSSNMDIQSQLNQMQQQLNQMQQQMQNSTSNSGSMSGGGGMSMM